MKQRSSLTKKTGSITSQTLSGSITTVGTSESQSQYSQQSVESEDEVETAESDFQNYGWKTILLLQFQPQFEIILMISIYIGYIFSLVDYAFAFGTPVENIKQMYAATGMSVLYCFDVIYMIDILSMLSFKNTEWEEVKHLYDKRHSLLVILDILSIVPWDALYYSLTDVTGRITYVLRLRYALRIFRFFNRMQELRDTVGHKKIFIEILAFLIYASLSLITNSCIHYRIVCEIKECAYQDLPFLLKSLYVTSSKLTSRGYSHPRAKIISLFILYVLLNFFSFLHISGFAVGRFLVATIHDLKRHHIFTNMQQMITSRVKRSIHKDALLFSTTKTFYSLYWKNRKGIIFKNFDKQIIPEIMLKEISLDITWDSLKHSHLFRDKEVHFLRAIAPLIKTKFMIPGEIIFQHNHFKSAMVYVVTGVIQVLSVQDSETTILSFSGGTCIGESSLFIDSPSTCTIVCQSYCELNILYKKDFIKIFLKYPAECERLVEVVKNRYEDVRQFQNMMKYISHGKSLKIDLLTLRWLKTTLQELMVSSNNTKYSKSLSESDRNTKVEYEKLVFCTNYLDMLVITEDIQLVTDTIFLKESCPCIIQPDTFIVSIWNTILAVSILIFIFLYPYYVAFQPNVSAWYLAYTYMLTFLYAFDIYINLSTAIKTKDEIITDIAKIALIKAKNFSFFIDAVAFVPFELCVLFVTMTLNSQVYVLLQMPKLLKSYKIWFLFTDNVSSSGATTRTHLKHTIYMIILIYYVAAGLYLQLCYQSVCNTKSIFFNFLNKISSGSRHTIDIIITFVYLSAQQATSLGMSIPVKGDFSSSYLSLLIIEYVFTLFYIYFITSTSTIETLRRYDKLRVQQFTSDVTLVLQKLKVNPELCKQVFVHIRGQLQYNNGIHILYSINRTLRQSYHPLLLKEYRFCAFGDLIKSVPLFRNLPDKVIKEIVYEFAIGMFAPGEIITYPGEICKEMHIIRNGLCQMIEPSEENNTKVVGPGYAISAMELCLEIPVLMSVITITHCEVISADSARLTHVLRLHSDVFAEVKNSVNILHLLQMSSTQQSIDGHEFYKTKDVREESFKHFGYFLDMETAEGVEFHTIFDNFGFFNFVRYLFMRHTIRANGPFAHYWEISRCIFALATAILSPIAPINACSDCVWSYIFIILDITAWIDVYIRHCICYFDEKGIEVMHPCKTTIYYWKHGFLVDILGVIPFERIIIPLFNLEAKNRTKVLLKTTRLLQIHRVFAGIQYLDQNFISASKIWTLIKFLPIILLTINTIGSIIINGICEFDPTISATEKFTAGVSCSPGTWLSESKFAKPLSPTRTHLYGLFYATVLTTGPGLGGFNVQTIKQAIGIILISLLGFWCFIYISSKIIAANLFRNADLTLYQESMSNLVKFLTYRHIDKNLKEEIITHFEYTWHKIEGKDLNKIITGFSYALQEDMLFDVYGKTMKESTIFSEANNSFFRSLLLQVKHQIILNRGIICQVNDVHGTMYFIFKGQVEVLGPDYNRMLVLPTGSVFGNLADCSVIRQTLTMVAKGHVELLCVESIVFHKILANYPNLKYNFHMLTAINNDYLLGAPTQSLLQESLVFKDNVYLGKNPVYKIINFFNTNASCRDVWNIIILIFVYYLGSISQLYQVTVQHNSLPLFIIFYLLDILHIIDIYLNFHIGYEDEFGILITDKKKIATRYLKSPSGFFLHVLTVLPFEIIALGFTGTMKWQIWSYCRCNRIIRMFFVNKYFQRKNQQLNINVYFMRIVSLIVWATLILQTLSSLFIISSCASPTFNISPTITCNWNNMTSQKKLDTYLNQFAVVIYIFTTSSMDDYFPNSSPLILLTMCLMIGSRFLSTIFVAEVAATLNIVLHNKVMYEEQIYVLREHMSRERVSPPLQERVWQYVCLLWKHRKGLQFPTLLEEAPYYLREGILNSMFGFHLRRHNVLRHCHVDLIRQMAAQIRPRIFFPGDYITFINDVDECMYFIDEGSVDALSEDELDTEKIEKTLIHDEMFGYDQGIHKTGHEFTYRANRYSVILILERKKWIGLLQFFPGSAIIIKKGNAD